MKKDIYHVFFFSIFLLSCTSHHTTTPTRLPTNEVSYPNSTVIPSSAPSKIPPNQSGFIELIPGKSTPLPFIEIKSENVYCQNPYVVLSYTEAQGLSDEDIAIRLMERHLSYFYSLQAPDWCRVDGYKVTDVLPYDVKDNKSPQGDIMLSVRFSIRLIQVPCAWMSLPGTFDTENWLHSGHTLAIFLSEEGYTMQFAYP